MGHEVFYSIPFQRGDVILTSMAEYGSNVIAFLQLRDKGVEIQVVPNDEDGQMDVDALAEMMSERVRVVAVSHMPTNGGLTQPAAAIGEVVAQWPAYYLLDACQTVGQMPIDVAEIKCDMLSATSRKYLRGPRGQGFVFVRSEVATALHPPILDNHAATWVSRDKYEIIEDARRFENWERSYANILGMREAVNHALYLGMPAIWNQIDWAASKLRSELVRIPSVRLTDVGAHKGGIVTFIVDNHSPDEIKTKLAEQAVNVSTSSIFSTRYDMEDRNLEKVVRASVHYLTTASEIERLCSVVAG